MDGMFSESPSLSKPKTKVFLSTQSLQNIIAFPKHDSVVMCLDIKATTTPTIMRTLNVIIFQLTRNSTSPDILGYYSLYNNHSD